MRATLLENLNGSVAAPVAGPIAEKPNQTEPKGLNHNF